MSIDGGDGSGDAEAPSHLAPGFLVGGGRYTLMHLIGRGGMGDVWLAHDERLNEQVALKFLPAVVRNDAVELARLRQETQKSRKLTHANIIRIYDLYEAPGELAFISMEYVNGPNLWEQMTRQAGGIFAWKELKPLVKQLCDALVYAHAERVIHRDLKPTNLMVDGNNRLKLADFGLAAVAVQADPASVERRFGGGTLTHMSPQQLAGEPPAVTDDIYSLGATLYDLLCGRPPFDEGDIAYQLRNHAPPPLQERLAMLAAPNDVPSEVAAMIMACLAKDPSKRPQSALAVAEWIGLNPTEAAPVLNLAASVSAKPEPSLPEEEPAKSGAWLVLVVVGVLVCAGVVFWFQRRSQPPAIIPVARAPVVATNAGVPEAEDPYVPAVLSLKPLAVWCLDETNGPTAYDSANEYDGEYDNVDLGLPGLGFAGAPKTGLSRKAARFAAGNGAASMIRFPGIDLSVPNGGNGRFAIALWIRASVLSKPGAGILCKGIRNGGEQFCLDCGGAAGAFRFFFRDSGGNTCWTVSSTKPDDKWHFLAGVCDQPNSRIYIYVDGAIAGLSTTTVGTGILASSEPAILGAMRDSRNAPYGAQFVGEIEDVAIFTNALSAEEIRGLYDAASKAPIVLAQPVSPPNFATASKNLLDTAFDAGAGPDGQINDMVLQRDGSILVAGNFDSFGGVVRRGIVRLKPDGELDVAKLEVNGAVDSLAVQPDGRILIGGEFSAVNAAPRRRVARLKTDLTVDPTFYAGAGPDREVLSVVMDDTNIFLAGAFLHIGEVNLSGVARLDFRGQIDPSFQIGNGADARVRVAAQVPGGKMLIGGDFRRYHGVSRPHLSGILSNGADSRAFRPDCSGPVHAILVLPDGKILIGGEFGSVHRIAFRGIARLTSNGALDTSFNPGSGADRNVETIALQNDGKILIGGDFASVNGVPRDHLARLRPNGSLDTGFYPKIIGDEVRKVLVQSDGKILVAGRFTKVEGASRAGLARLSP